MSDLDAEVFARIAVELSDQAGTAETVDVVVRYALAAVDADSASVMLLHRGGRDIEITGTTDPPTNAGRPGPNGSQTNSGSVACSASNSASHATGSAH